MSGCGSRYNTIAASSAALLLVILFVQATATAADQPPAGQSAPDIATMVKHITEAQLENRSRGVPYSVTREYKVFGSDGNRPRSEVVAKINFLPPNVKSYDIDQSTGGMGEKVVRRILDHEVDVTRDPKSMMIGEQNYTFEFAGEGRVDGKPSYALNISPRRDRKELLKAKIWVDKDSYRILRIEGQPLKSPSFWVKDVHLVLEFGEVAGMWLQTETHAFARLRFGGEYNLSSQDLNYDVSNALAVKTRPAPARRRHSAAMLAAGVR